MSRATDAHFCSNAMREANDRVAGWMQAAA